MITEEQMKMLEYHERGLALMKTDIQLIAIDLQKQKKIQEKRKEIQRRQIRNVKPLKRTPSIELDYINYNEINSFDYDYQLQYEGAEQLY